MHKGMRKAGAQGQGRRGCNLFLSVAVAVVPLWEPGMNSRQPFSIVQSSRANHRPIADNGSVWRNVESW